MKKIYTLAAIFILAAFGTVSAQVSYGIGAGVNRSSLRGDAMGSLQNVTDFADGIITTQPRTGFYAGGFVEMPLGAGFSLQPAVYYSQKGYVLRGAIPGDKLDFLGIGARASLQSHYIDIPVVFKAEVAKGLQVFAGPQLSYLVKNNLRVDARVLGISLFNTKMDVTENFNKADWGLTGGVGYTFDNGFSLNASYDHGLTRVDRNNTFHSFNRNIRVGVAVKF